VDQIVVEVQTINFLTLDICDSCKEISFAVLLCMRMMYGINFPHV